MKQGTRVWLRREDADQPIYGRVTAVTDSREAASTFRIEFAGTNLTANGAELDLFYHLDGEFWSQRCTVRGIKPSRNREIVVLETLDDPSPANRRRALRFDSYLHGVTASIRGGAERLVLNVSDGGLSLTGSENLEVGEVVKIEVRWKGQACIGRVQVRHVSDTVRGARIYGFACRGGRSRSGLGLGLARIAKALEKAQCSPMNMDATA